MKSALFSLSSVRHSSPGNLFFPPANKSAVHPPAEFGPCGRCGSDPIPVAWICDRCDRHICISCFKTGAQMCLDCAAFVDRKSRFRLQLSRFIHRAVWRLRRRVNGTRERLSFFLRPIADPWRPHLSLDHALDAASKATTKPKPKAAATGSPARASIWDRVRNVFDNRPDVVAKKRADSLMWVVNPSLTPEDRKHIAEIFDTQLALCDGKTNLSLAEAHEHASVNARIHMEQKGIRLNGQHAVRYRRSNALTSGKLIHFKEGYKTYKETVEWRVSRSDRTVESLQRFPTKLRGIVKEIPKITARRSFQTWTPLR